MTDLVLTAAQLQAICITEAGKQRCLSFLPYLNTQAAKYGIATPNRYACLLAQLAHESAEFHYTAEIASGAAYEGRKDLGNTQPGDGERYKGRGLIQITGRANYAKCGAALGQDLIAHPERLEQADIATASACWFWSVHHLNEAADSGDFLHITRTINGGINGMKDRLMYLASAKKALGIS